MGALRVSKNYNSDGRQGGSRWQGKGEGQGHVKEFTSEPEVVEKSLGLHNEDQKLDGYSTFVLVKKK